MLINFLISNLFVAKPCVSGVVGPAMHTSSGCVTVLSDPSYRGGFSDSLTFCVVALGLESLVVNR